MTLKYLLIIIVVPIFLTLPTWVMFTYVFSDQLLNFLFGSPEPSLLKAFFLSVFFGILCSALAEINELIKE